MTRSQTIYQVDAFTSEPFRGNPAGVCILENQMSDNWMQNIAAELHVSETAFISAAGDGYDIRFFTPVSEVPLCGHATLSSAHIMYENGIVQLDDDIHFSSKAGKLKIRYSDSWIIMNFPSYSLSQVPVPEYITRYTGIVPDELYRTEHGWMLAFLSKEEALLNLNPDFKAMKNSEFGDLIVTSPSSDPNFDFCVRCFAPALGIDEDPVTGSAQCVLVPFWHNKTGRTDFVSHQVSGRGGVLKGSLVDNRVEIAGQAKTVFRAELFV